MLTIQIANGPVASKQHVICHLKCLPNVINGWLYLNRVSISCTVDYSNARSLNNGLCHCFARKKSPSSNRRKKDLVRVKTQ